jgi:hypothetical protein
MNVVSTTTTMQFNQANAYHSSPSATAFHKQHSVETCGLQSPSIHGCHTLPNHILCIRLLLCMQYVFCGSTLPSPFFTKPRSSPGGANGYLLSTIPAFYNRHTTFHNIPHA